MKKKIRRILEIIEKYKDQIFTVSFLLIALSSFTLILVLILKLIIKGLP